tara:strand:- start:183 stop:398 length:216 start_codon:yes stop_codon:yes gene_type:complete
MDKFNISELGIFISVCSASLVGLLIACFKSRCDEIQCCGIKIHRKVLDEKSPKKKDKPVEEENILDREIPI